MGGQDRWTVLAMERTLSRYDRQHLRNGCEELGVFGKYDMEGWRRGWLPGFMEGTHWIKTPEE